MKGKELIPLSTHYATRLQQDILVQFLNSATVGVIEWWFTSSMPYSAADITEQLWTLLENNQMIPPTLDDINC
ncbi:TetR-like C-terminal domain-containing protein [Paenibacillus marchantiophytorum]|uniref:TetR-like C-terminal domain-containing protein n=1 Tax=Paenibacillus marchantiophytorum TaxID=1619310 RepID=UPI0027E3EBDE|nr:TetR-like C-terminal domain-containing protein [Paenibacillus marchantiophytorum]